MREATEEIFSPTASPGSNEIGWLAAAETSAVSRLILSALSATVKIVRETILNVSSLFLISENHYGRTTICDLEASARGMFAAAKALAPM
jgi:hypothetical protein